MPDSQPAASSIEQQWQDRGHPAELLARARAIRMPDNELAGMLHWNAPAENIERRVFWWETIAKGNIRWRQLTVRDNDDFCELWANSPEDIGDWQVTVERGPNGFAQFELQERPVLNALFDGLTMVACVSFAPRETVVGGERIWVHYGQAMRVHKDHRRHGYGNWVRSLPWGVGLWHPTHNQYDYLRSDNMTMEAWNRKMMPNLESVPKRDDQVPGIPVTVLQFAAKPNVAGTGVRTARKDDLGQCVELINRTHEGRDLFRPYTLDFLRNRLFASIEDLPTPFWSPPYRIGDLHVLERDGEIVACAGLWDRGRDMRERWHHRETGEERVVTATALLDFGFAEGREDALAALIEHCIALTHTLGRNHLVAPLETQPRVAELLASHAALPEVRYLQWRTDARPITPPVHLDLVYW